MENEKKGACATAAKLSPLSLSPPPSEFCNDENNSVIRSAMDALRNFPPKISLLAARLGKVSLDSVRAL